MSRRKASKSQKSNVLDTSFYISSHDIAPEFMSGALRGHWQIENCLRWVLDVVYKEDACRVYEQNSAEALAVVRRIVLNLAKLETTQKRNMKSKTQRTQLSDDYREMMIFGGC